MPRLPDKDALGALPSLRSGRDYPTAGQAKADVSGEEASSIALAKGFQTMARTVEGIAEEEVKQEDALDLIRANAAHSERLRDINNSFDTDPDWKTYRPRFADSATQATADAGSGIRNANLRKRWIEQAHERNSVALDRVVDRGTRLQKEEKELEVDKVLEQYRKLYSEAGNDEDRQRILQDMDVTVTAAQRTGLLDVSRGEAKRKRALDDVLKDDAERRLLSGDSIGVMRDLGALRDPNAKPTGRRFRPDVQMAIDNAASKVDLDPGLMATIARIESSGDPNVVTGSYKGVFQLSEAEFRKNGGKGSIFDPVANAEAAAIKLKAESDTFERKYGRPPTAAEIYLIHQQGEGGADAHWRNPDQPAWKSMASTGEGRQKGERWAKQAIWGNVPDDLKAQYGSVDNITSGQFVEMWTAKVDRLGGGGAGGMGQPSAAYSKMSFAARHALVTRAKIAMSADTQQDLKDAYQDIMDTGEAKRGPDGSTALDRARLFLQPNQVKRAELQLEEARSLYDAVSPLRGMTEAEAVQHLQRFHDPNATGDRAALSRRVAAKAEAAWEEIQSERMTDPVEAIDPFRNVRTGKAGRTQRAPVVSGAYDMIKRRFPDVAVRETVAGGYEIMDPESPTPETMAKTHQARRALIDARIEAQAKLGIPRHARQPISKREGDMLLDLPENVNSMTPQEYRIRLQSAADRAESRYGKEMGPVVLEAALSMRKAGDADHKQEADRLMARLARGEAVARSDIRRLNDLRDLERRTMRFDQPSMADYERGRAMAPLPPPQAPAAIAPPTQRSRSQDAARPSSGPQLPEKPREPRRTQRGYYDRQPQPNPFDADDEQLQP